MTTLTIPIIGQTLESADDALAVLWGGAVQPVAGLPFVARAASAAAADLVRAASITGRETGEHVHLANAYSVAVADERPDIADVFTDRRSWLLPDGRPLVWLSGLRRDRPRLQQVRGPQLMLDVADLGRTAGLRHYLLGGSPEVLQDLQANLSRRFPGISIVGACSPPFRAPDEDELRQRDADIRRSGAQIVWVGLGTPKQDVEAARLAAGLPVVAVAVGAAFDYAAGALRAAPHWISVAGLEWLWRFAAEPRRLWKRYTVGNARFLTAVSVAEVRRRLPGRRIRSTTTVVGQLPPPLHGSAVMTERLVEALRCVGQRVEVVDRRFSRDVGEVGRPSLRKLAAVPSLLGRSVRATRRSDRLVMLITSSPASFVIDCLLLRATARPVVLYVHTVGFRALAARSRLLSGLVRSAFGRADRVVVLGESLVDDVLPFTSRSRIDVVPNVTPPAPRVPHADGHRVLFLSNLLPGKGADVFVRVARDLQERRPGAPWSFDLAGAGDATALGSMPSSVVVHGAVQAAAKRDLLQSADLLLVPSTYAMEAQPLVIVEALAHGLPVVAYDTGGIRDLVDASVGVLVPAGDEPALADAVLEMLETPERRARAARAARERYERRHSPEAFAERWSEVVAKQDAQRRPR